MSNPLDLASCAGHRTMTELRGCWVCLATFRAAHSESSMYEEPPGFWAWDDDLARLFGVDLYTFASGKAWCKFCRDRLRQAYEQKRQEDLIAAALADDDANRNKLAIKWKKTES